MKPSFNPVAKSAQKPQGLPGITVPVYRDSKYALGFIPLDDIGFYYQPDGLDSRWTRMERKSRPEPYTVIGLDFKSLQDMITLAHNEQRTVDFRDLDKMVMDPDVFKTFGRDARLRFDF